MHSKSFVISLVFSCVIICSTSQADAKKYQSGVPTATLLASGLAGATCSTIGPDRTLYVTEGAVGKISRVDPWTGAVTTFTSGLPNALIGIGGAIDIAFLGKTAYVVTLTGEIWKIDSIRRHSHREDWDD